MYISAVLNSGHEKSCSFYILLFPVAVAKLTHFPVGRLNSKQQEDNQERLQN